ncbi:hypothetical protein EJ06DRAFT_158222 [Trichodelitschia bisporula]|uniref:DUF1772-domain-containing protein n=1 Tax=Trichodelitschia bisporula TaxID=703511 RepID=A0A6G1HMF5_9PEZI|nr:hypothetical protein EJ06DRAFT_158222 [Trichodelitschia bisporula]
MASLVIAGCIAADFVLAGNAVTQSFMTLPALLAHWPMDGPARNARIQLLSRQWPVCWVVGNQFFRPLSTLTTVGYAYTAWSLWAGPRTVGTTHDWRPFAANALLHFTVIVHSAINMQPLNDRIAAADDEIFEVGTKWMRLNLYRLAIPLVTGVVAMWQAGLDKIQM